MSDVKAVMDLRGEEPQQLALPPGYRFHPTDEEVVTHYLTPNITNSSSCLVVVDINLNNTEPWDLPEAAKMGDNEWFFFVHKDRKYPTGTRTNRATRSGYWKATGKDKQIFRGTVLIGIKKTLVFYRGRAPSGRKMPWVMHEYRLHGELPHRLPRSAKDDWAVCRVFNKDLADKNAPLMAPKTDRAMEEDPFAFLDELLNSDDMLNNTDLLNNADLPMLMDSPPSPVDFTSAPVLQHQSPNYMWKMM